MSFRITGEKILTGAGKKRRESMNRRRNYIWNKWQQSKGIAGIVCAYNVEKRWVRRKNYVINCSNN